jgi:hypothetical protein
MSDKESGEQAPQRSRSGPSDIQNTPVFKPPPTVECIINENCLSIGRRKPKPGVICGECLRRHDLHRLAEWAKGDTEAVARIEEELFRKQQIMSNLESRGRYLCAFEDPDFGHCRWREPDLNLRGTRTDCAMAKRKGMACSKCWSRHLEKIEIIQYFTPTGMCHEEADKVAALAKDSQVSHAELYPDEDEEDVESYNTI